MKIYNDYIRMCIEEKKDNHFFQGQSNYTDIAAKAVRGGGYGEDLSCSPKTHDRYVIYENGTFATQKVIQTFEYQERVGFAQIKNRVLRRIRINKYSPTGELLKEEVVME